MPDELTYNFPARIIERATPIEELRQLLRGVDLEEGIEPFFWPAEISSYRLDSYFTHMAESTLRNFAADATAGVSFLDSHDARRLGYGQSLAGVMEVRDGITRVVADFYTVPGIRFGGALTYQSTDDFIRAVRSRLARDVSVGFHGGDIICDICGNSLYDWRNCSHWPGVEYAIGEKGEQTVIATATIEEAHLGEVSAVYDGATPGAMILRAQQQAEAGLLEPETVRRLEAQYRIKLPGRQVWTGVNLEKRSNSMDDNKIEGVLLEVEAPPIPDEARQVLARAGYQEAGTVADITGLLTGLRWLADEVGRLRPLADDGKAYRVDLVEEALAEGVRAMGAAFPVETYRGMLGTATLDSIKSIRDTFKAQAALALPGGVHVEDTPPPAPRKQPETPNVAFTG